jgi:hypothetical protein
MDNGIVRRVGCAHQPIPLFGVPPSGGSDHDPEGRTHTKPPRSLSRGGRRAFIAFGVSAGRGTYSAGPLGRGWAAGAIERDTFGGKEQRYTGHRFVSPRSYLARTSQPIDKTEGGSIEHWLTVNSFPGYVFVFGVPGSHWPRQYFAPSEYASINCLPRRETA